MTQSGRYWSRHDLNQRTGSDIFDHLFQPSTDPPSSAGHSLSNRPIAVLLESPHPSGQRSIVEASPHQNPLHTHGVIPRLSRYSICAGPPHVLSGQPQVWTPQVGNILSTLRRLTLAGPACGQVVASASPERPVDTLPFLGGWLGWLGYDLAWEIEQLPQENPEQLPFPVAFWYEPACFAVLDHLTQHLWLSAPSDVQLSELQQRLQMPLRHTSPSRGTTRDVIFSCDQSTYEAAVRAAKQYIRAGDVFQVNLSLRFETETTAEPWQVYQNLQRINPSPFASYWQTPWGTVLSCSPERLVQSNGRQAQTRPIAGTRPRGQTPQQDQQLAVELRSNIKEQAEHIMLVDLERNDLGRVCEWGTVDTNELLVIERYSHVMHLVSNVIGTLASQATAIDVIAAMFPGGTITGCPKVRCMEIIEALEPVRRNLFYGSCGYLDYRGHLDLNILIRTLVMSTPISLPSSRGGLPVPRRQVWGQVGAGIVADSDPQKEWLEALQKSKAQLLSLEF